MLLSRLPFGSLLAYSPHGETDAASLSRTLRDDLKRDRVNASGRSFSIRMAAFLSGHAQRPELAKLFGPDVCLVPVPRSKLPASGDAWVPLQLALALRDAGLAGETLPLLQRRIALPKAATSPPSLRPLPEAHASSFAVEAQLLRSSRLLLVDDIVTRGATLLGAASRLNEAYPSTPIAGFAAMRTISSPDDFHGLLDPVVGEITLRPQGDTLRRP